MLLSHQTLPQRQPMNRKQRRFNNDSKHLNQPKSIMTILLFKNFYGKNVYDILTKGAFYAINCKELNIQASKTKFIAILVREREREKQNRNSCTIQLNTNFISHS